MAVVRAALVRLVVAATCATPCLAAQSQPPPPFAISGTVVDVARTCIAGAEVQLIRVNSTGGLTVGAATTDSGGRFHCPGVILSGDEGRWRLEARAPGLATSVLEWLPGGFGSYDVGLIYLFQPVTITGMVLDERDRPIVGAKVYATAGACPEWPTDQAPVCISQEDGSFNFTSLPPGRFTLGASAVGYADAVVSDLWMDATGAPPWTIRMGPGRTVDAAVVDSAGKPVDGAFALAETKAFWKIGAFTNSSGRVEINGLDSTTPPRWSIQARGYVPRSFDAVDGLQMVALDASESLDIQVVRDGAGPAPVIEEITIRDSTPPGLCGFAYGKVELKDAQSYAVEVLGPGAWRVFLDAALALSPDQQFNGAASGVSVRLADGSRGHVSFEGDFWHGRTFTVHVPATGGIRGRVFDRESRKPVAGTTVLTNCWSVIGPDLITTTDADGRYEFLGMAPGDLHDVTVRNESWYGEQGEFSVVAGEITEGVDVLVSSPGAIVGRVTYKGRAPGEQVVLGLGEFQDNDVVEGGLFGIGISDRAGNYRIIPDYGRRLTVVPKNRTTPELGGYRQFLKEFPETPRDSWPWMVDARTRSTVEFDLDLRE